MSRNPIYIKLINSVRWQKLRAKKIRDNPLCELCEAGDLSVLATEVHHRIPVESEHSELGMTRLMFDYRNLQSLCHSCHSDIHKQMRSHSKEAIQENNKRATKRFEERFLK